MTETFDLVVRAPRALIDGTFQAVEIGIVGGRIGVIVAAAIPPGTIVASSNVAGSSTLGNPILRGLETLTLAPDEVLIPGLVDTHVHVNEPGRTEWEGFASATRAAAAGGVTTIIDMPLNSIPPTTTVAGLAAKRAVAAGVIDIGFWGGAVPGNLGSLRALHDEGVFGFKAFLAPSGVEEFAHLDSDELERALVEVASLDSVLIVHAEDPGVLDAYANSGGRDYRRFVESRPDAAETTAIERVIEGVRRTGARAHILHLSSARSLPALRAARAEGLPITVETCPHYLVLAEELIPDGATAFKCCPPIRDESNRDQLWAALLEGDIDMVVTDHSPSTAALKHAGEGDFGVAWGGIAGLQLGLAAVWTQASRRGIPLERVVEWMSRRPADLVGLAHKGRIAVGADADLVAFAPEARFTVDAAQLLHKNAVSAYDGMPVRGLVRRTWLRGRPISTGADGRGAGRLLRR